MLLNSHCSSDLALTSIYVQWITEMNNNEYMMVDAGAIIVLSMPRPDDNAHFVRK